MNKSGFIEKLGKETGYSEEKCMVINSIMEDTFIIGKSGKEKLVARFADVLGLNKEEAEKLYETVMGIVGDSLKNKLKHPFKD